MGVTSSGTRARTRTNGTDCSSRMSGREYETCGRKDERERESERKGSCLSVAGGAGTPASSINHRRVKGDITTKPTQITETKLTVYWQTVVDSAVEWV